MEQFEKVRKGLRCHSDVFNEEPDCEHCEYDNANCGLEVPSDALALIRQQRARIAELEESQRMMVYQDCLRPDWISVKDRLPEEHADEHPYEFEQYLCATVWNDVRTVGFGTRIGDDKQHFWSGTSIWDDWVTHWMPFPEPPKEEEHADGA